jgi:hypothetical protein
MTYMVEGVVDGAVEEYGEWDGAVPAGGVVERMVGRWCDGEDGQ